MTNHPEHLDRIEHLLGELGDAERAGVFRPTLVDASSLVGRASVSSRNAAKRWLLWVPAAACVIFMVSMGGWLFSGGVNPMADYQPMAGASAGPALDLEGFSGCLAGPSETLVSSGCSSFDQDHDGDVDLADYNSLMLAAGR